MASAEGGELAIAVAYSPRAGAIDLCELTVQEGATLADAINASGLLERHAELDLATLKVGLWGRLRPLETPLRMHDRVEVYRPLMIDPKEARRVRQRGQRSR